MKNKFKVTFEGNGTTVNVDVSSDIAHDLLKQIFSQKEIELSQIVNFKDTSDHQEISIWKKFNAKRNIEKIALIAYFMKNYKDWFKRKDIDNYLIENHSPMIKNFSRDIDWAIRVGWIEEDKKSFGNFKITQKGIEAVCKKFSDEIKKKTRIISQK